MSIRLANKNDARKLSYLIRKNTENVKENHYSQEQIKIWKKANSPKAIEESMSNRIIFCAFQNGKLVGTIALQEKQIVGLYVSYTKRKSGLGTKLLQHLEDYAKTNGLKELTLTATPSAKQFYRHRGYEVIKSLIVKIEGIEFKETLMSKKL